MMSTKNRFKQLGESWVALATIALDPMVILGVVVTVGLGLALAKNTTNATVVALLTVLFGLVSGLAGAILESRTSAVMERKPIAARGQAAVRSLKVLLNGVVAMEKEIRRYQADYAADEIGALQVPGVVKTQLEGIGQQCWGLEEQVVNAIENWTDIVEEAGTILTNIGEVTELRSELVREQKEAAALKARADTLQGQLEQAAGSKEELEKTKTEYRKATERLTLTQNRLLRIQRNLAAAGTELGTAFSGAGLSGCLYCYLNTPPQPIADAATAASILARLIRGEQISEFERRYLAGMGLLPGESGKAE